MGFNKITSTIVAFTLSYGRKNGCYRSLILTSCHRFVLEYTISSFVETTHIIKPEVHQFRKELASKLDIYVDKKKEERENIRARQLKKRGVKRLELCLANLFIPFDYASNQLPHPPRRHTSWIPTPTITMKASWLRMMRNQLLYAKKALMKRWSLLLVPTPRPLNV